MASAIADPANSVVYLLSKTFTDEMLPLKEKWYKIDYSSESYPEDLYRSLRKPSVAENGKKLDLPPVNTLLPSKFDQLPSDKSLAQKTQLIQSWDVAELWYKKDEKFNKPKGFINVINYTAESDFWSTSLGSAFSDIW